MFGKVTRLFPQVGCAKNKLLSHTVQRKLRGLRMDGIPALDLWDLVIEVFHSSPNQQKKSKGRVQGNLPITKPRLQFSTTILN